jgi:hypothetical protein
MRARTAVRFDPLHLSIHLDKFRLQIFSGPTPTTRSLHGRSPQEDAAFYSAHAWPSNSPISTISR